MGEHNAQLEARSKMSCNGLAQASQKVQQPQQENLAVLQGGSELKALASELATPPPFPGKELLIAKGNQQAEGWY